MTDGAYQAVTASAIPVTALSPPPEGQRQALLKITLTPTNFSQSFAPVLANAGLSQVVTLFVDNSQNAAALTVIHGALNQIIIVPAGGGAFIPTSSTTALAYFVSISVASAPVNNVTVNLTLYNYFIGPSIYGNTVITNTTTIAQSALDNPFENAACAIAQGGTAAVSMPVGTTYAPVDGWIVIITGAAVSAQQAGSIGLALNSLKITGGTSNTDVKIARRIESYNAAPFAGNQVQLQFKIENNSGSAIAPSIAVQYPISQDVFSTLAAAEYSGNAQVCPNGATTQCALSFPITTSSTGLQITIDLGALASNAASVQISEIDMILATGSTTGLIASPGAPRFIPLALDYQNCMRYYEVLQNNVWGASPSGDTFATWAFKARKRATPTMSMKYGTPANPYVIGADSYVEYLATGGDIEFLAGSSASARL